MPVWRKMLITLCVLVFMGASVNVMAKPLKEYPDPALVIVDVVPVRVLGAGALVVGGAVFVVTLPFTALSDDFGNAWGALVKVPFHFTFTRPVGEFDDWREEMDARNEEEEMREQQEAEQS